MKKEKKIYAEVQRIAKENDCNDDFVNNFHSVYTFMHESISDLSVSKQILITIKAMTVGTKAQRNELRNLAAYMLKPKILS